MSSTVVQWSESALTPEQAWYMTSSVFVALLSEQVLHVVFLVIQNSRNQEADCDLLLKIMSRLGTAISKERFLCPTWQNATLVCGSSWPQYYCCLWEFLATILLSFWGVVYSSMFCLHCPDVGGCWCD